MRRSRTSPLVVLTLILLPQMAGAAIVQYDDRAAWEAAAGGPPDFTEDFEGFAADVDFRPEPTTVAIAMGTIGQVGLDLSFRNKVDVPPFDHSDNNGTSHASCFTNFPEVVFPGTNVEIVFTENVSAWGAELTEAREGEFVSVDAVEAGTGTVLGSVEVSDNGTVFLGFVADAGEEIGSVFIRSTNFNPGGFGEGFGMDDIVVVNAAPDVPLVEIPTMTQVGLVLFVVLLIGASLLVLRRRA